MKKKSIFLMVFIFIATAISAQRVFFIDYDSLYRQIPAYQKKQVAFDSLKLKMTIDIQQRDLKLNEKLGVLLKKYNVTPTENSESIKPRMSKEDAEQLTELEKENNEIEARDKRYNALLEELYKLQIKPITDFIDLEIAKYCQKKKIMTLYRLENMTNSLVYYNEKIDITPDLVKELNTKLILR